MSQTLWLTSDFKVVECYKCGIAFGMPADWDKKLRRNHKTFWCPKGHGQVYNARSDEQKLKDRLKTVMDDRDACLSNMENQVAELQTVVRSERGKAGYFRGKFNKATQAEVQG